jgi:rhodanese-related sulfurtransferase
MTAAVDRLLARARAVIAPRPGPAELATVWAAGGLVVDTRPVELRARDGEMPGALVVDRNVLEWRLDPTSPHRLDAVTGPDQPVVLVCDEGYASSLAAVALRQLGLHRATDLDGGFQAWRRGPEGSKPASPPPARPASRRTAWEDGDRRPAAGAAGLSARPAP